MTSHQTSLRNALAQPRNAEAIIDAVASGVLEHGDSVVVSFVGRTDLVEPHVFADSGKRYDWRCLAGLHVTIVVKPRQAVVEAMRELFALTVPYPTIVDFERQVVGSLIDEARVWPRRKGSEPWLALFG